VEGKLPQESAVLLATHLDVSDLAEPRVIAERNTGQPFAIDKPKKLNQGTATTPVAMLSPAVEAPSGVYLEDCRVLAPYKYVSGEGNAERLWELSEKMVGKKFEVGD
jgi:hypothetical protein